jgi:hypothetical protein
MIFNGEGSAALRVDRSDFVFEFLEPAFDFPPGGVEFDHLLGGEFEIGGDQREHMVLSIDEDDFDLAFESAGHADDFGEEAFPISSVDVYSAVLADSRRLAARSRTGESLSPYLRGAPRRLGSGLGSANRELLTRSLERR